MGDFQSDWYEDSPEKPRGRLWHTFHNRDGEAIGAGPLWLWLLISALTVGGMATALVGLFNEDPSAPVSRSIGYFVLLVVSLGVGWFGFRTAGDKLLQRGREGWGLAAGCLSIVLALVLAAVLLALIT